MTSKQLLLLSLLALTACTQPPKPSPILLRRATYQLGIGYLYGMSVANIVTGERYQDAWGIKNFCEGLHEADSLSRRNGLAIVDIESLESMKKARSICTEAKP